MPDLIRHNFHEDIDMNAGLHGIKDSRAKIILEPELVSVRYISALLICAKKMSRLKLEELKEYTDRLSKLQAPLQNMRKLSGAIMNVSLD
jgi:hypothetical protein